MNTANRRTPKKFKSWINRYTACAGIFLCLGVFSMAVRFYSVTKTGLSGPTQTITISPELSAAGLSVFVSGDGVEKVGDMEYRVEVGSLVTLAAISERAEFKSWELTGADVAASANAYTTIKSMPPNDVTVGAFATPARRGTTLATAYTLSGFEDFYALQEIVANQTVPTGQEEIFNGYLSRFGLTGSYAALRPQLQYGHFQVTATVSLTEPKPAGASDTWTPTRFFTGIGRTNVVATSFQGVIDGGGYPLVLNMHVITAASAHQYFGLFGAVPSFVAGTVNGVPRPPVTLRNLKVIGGILTDVQFGDANLNCYTGGVAGLLNDSVVMTGCESKVFANVKTTYTKASASRVLYLGGLVGYNKAPIAHGSGNRYNAAYMTLSGESNSAVFAGGCYGMCSAYVLDATATLDDCQVSALSTNTAVAMSAAHAGGIVGHFNANAKLSHCRVLCPNTMLINATTDGISAAFIANSGGIAGLISGSAVLFDNTVDADSDKKANPDTMGDAAILARDLSAGSVSTVYAGGLYGRFASSTVQLLAPFSSLGDDSRDVFHGRVHPTVSLNGKSTSYVGGIMGYGHFAGGAIPSFDLSDVRVSTLQKNTTTKYTNASGGEDPSVGASYTGGLAGGMPSGVALSGITLYGDNVTIEQYREPGASGNNSAISVGGLLGQKTGGTVSRCEILFTNSKISLNQESYLSAAGNARIGGLIGFADSGCVISDCTVAGSPGHGSTTDIQCTINTISTAHGTADGYVGGIVGHAKSNSHVIGCRYIGSKSGGRGGVRLVSNNSSNSPCVAGIVGLAEGARTTDCHVENAIISGDGYNNDPLKTDTDIIVGGIVGLTNGASSVENCSVRQCRMEAIGRDYTLTYAAGIMGAQFGTGASIVRGCLSEKNEIMVHAQKKWAAGGGIVGYHYDSTLVVDNCMSVGDTIYATADNVEAGQYTEAIGGGIVGRINHVGALTTKVTNCYASNRMVLTHVDDSKICLGGLIGFRKDMSALTATNSFFHIQNAGTTSAVGYLPPSTALTNLNLASGLDFSPITLDDITPKRVVFVAKPTSANSSIVPAGDEPSTHDIEFLTTPDMIGGVNVNNQYAVTKRPDITGTGASVFRAQITHFVPGSAYPAGTPLNTSTLDFGLIQVTALQGTAPVIASVTLYEDGENGTPVSAAYGNLFLKLPVNLDLANPGKTFAAVSDPSLETTPGQQTLVSFRFFTVTDSLYTPILPAALTKSGVNITVTGNLVTVKPNTPIDAPRTLAIQAVDATTGTVFSERVTITIVPVFVQAVRLDSYVSPEKAGFGSIQDTANPLGSQANPFILVSRSALKLNVKVYGEGSTDEKYVAPTNAGALFGPAEWVSGTANAVSVYADGTVFSKAVTGAITPDTLYRARALSVGKGADGDQVASAYYYIRLVDPPKVTKLTGGSLARDFFESPSGQSGDVGYVLRGGNLDGPNNSLLPWNVDYVFTTEPQAAYGGEPEVFYVFGEPGDSNPFRKIEIGEPNGIAYGRLIGSVSKAQYEFTIKENPNLAEGLTITVKYFESTSVLFYPQDGHETIFMNVALGRPFGNANLSAVAPPERRGYVFDGWYPVDDTAQSEEAYGAVLTKDTVITGGNVYYGRWRYKLILDDSAALPFAGLLPLNELQDFSFEIVKKAGFFGAPICRVQIGGADNPLPIPGQYDEPTTVQYRETVEGVDTLCAELTILQNKRNDTVYAYTFYRDYISRNIAGSEDGPDGIFITTGNASALIIPDEGTTAGPPDAILQDTVFTVRCMLNHAGGILPGKATYAYRAENQTQTKDFRVQFSEVLPKGTVIRLHHRVDQAYGGFTQDVWKYVLPTSSTGFSTSAFTAIGGNTVFPSETFAQFTRELDMIHEEYDFVVILPYQSDALAVGTALAVKAGFVEEDEGMVPDTITGAEIKVAAKRNLSLIMTETAQVVRADTGGTLRLTADFSDILATELQARDNRERSFGLAISFTDAQGKLVRLPAGSRVSLSDPERTVASTSDAPLETYFFALRTGTPELTVAIAPGNAALAGGYTPPSLSPGSYTMNIKLVSWSRDNLYGFSHGLEELKFPVLVT